MCLNFSCVLRLSHLGDSGYSLETKTEVNVYEEARIIEAYHTGDENAGENADQTKQVKR